MKTIRVEFAVANMSLFGSAEAGSGTAKLQRCLAPPTRGAK